MEPGGLLKTGLSPSHSGGPHPPSPEGPSPVGSLLGRVTGAVLGLPCSWPRSSPAQPLPPAQCPVDGSFWAGSFGAIALTSSLSLWRGAERPKVGGGPRWKEGKREGAGPIPPPGTLLSPAPLTSRRPRGPVPTILEGQELKDTVDDGHDDGERQQVGVGL